MVQRMAKPEEVIVVENEQGEVVREVIKDTDAMNLYKSMRESLGRWLPVVLWSCRGWCACVVVVVVGRLQYSFSLSLLLPAVYLTHLDYEDTERIMTDKLYRQVDGSEWSWKNLNTVSVCVCVCVWCVVCV